MTNGQSTTATDKKRRRRIFRLLLLLFTLVMLLPDSYIFARHHQQWPLWAQIAWWLPTAITVAILYNGQHWKRTWRFTTVMVTTMCCTLPKIVYTLCALAGQGIACWWPPANDIGHLTGLAAAAATLITMAYGFIFGWKRIAVRHVDIFFPHLPEDFDGYRLVQLSDLHISTMGKDRALLKKIIDQVNTLHADAIAFTGDLINMTYEEVTPVQDQLSRLRARDGVFSVFGNHDYAPFDRFLRPGHPADTPLIEKERAMGWHLLLNEHCLISRGASKIAFVGVENIGRRPFPKMGRLDDALKGLPHDVFAILLSHDPSHWRMEVLPSTNIPLTLSGHTHAGQMKIGGWSPVKWIYREWSGLYEEGGQYLYVSEGTGARVPFRVGTKAEITLICLHRKT